MITINSIIGYRLLSSLRNRIVSPSINKLNGINNEIKNEFHSYSEFISILADVTKNFFEKRKAENELKHAINSGIRCFYNFETNNTGTNFTILNTKHYRVFLELRKKYIKKGWNLIPIFLTKENFSFIASRIENEKSIIDNFKNNKKFDFTKTQENKERFEVKSKKDSKNIFVKNLKESNSKSSPEQESNLERNLSSSEETKKEEPSKTMYSVYKSLLKLSKNRDNLPNSENPVLKEIFESEEFQYLYF